jgi:hypothetical protein
MAFGPIPLNQDVMTHLRRLGLASSAGEVIKELQWLAPNLGPGAMLSESSLSALTALAEAHVRERCEPSHDPLTGALDAAAFQELWEAYARRAPADVAPVAVVLSLLDGGDPRRSGQAPAELRALAAICTDHIAADDYVGRVAPASLAVLPRHGGLRGAQSVRARLLAAFRRHLAHVGYALRVDVALKDVDGATLEQSEELLGALPIQ